MPGGCLDDRKCSTAVAYRRLCLASKSHLFLSQWGTLLVPMGDNDMYDGPGLIDKAIGARAARDSHDFDAACIAGAVFPRELKMSDSRDF